MATDESRSAGTVAPGGAEEYVDDRFDVLSNPRRRFVAASLDGRNTATAVVDLADELARWERDSRGPGGPDDWVESRYRSLKHVHLPTMAAAGLVEYDRETETVVLADEYAGIADEVPLFTVG